MPLSLPMPMPMPMPMPSIIVTLVGAEGKGEFPP